MTESLVCHAKMLECVPGSSKALGVLSRQQIQIYPLARSAPMEKKLKNGGQLGDNCISSVESKDGKGLTGAMVIVMERYIEK